MYLSSKAAEFLTRKKKWGWPKWPGEVPFNLNYPTSVYRPRCSGESGTNKDTVSQFSTSVDPPHLHPLLPWPLCCLFPVFVLVTQLNTKHWKHETNMFYSSESRSEERIQCFFFFAFFLMVGNSHGKKLGT